MKIITKYLCREFFFYFIISLILFLSIYLSVDFFGKIDSFFEAHLPLSVALSFIICKIPSALQQMIPIAVLISVMLLLSVMNKHNEILAIKNCGTNLFCFSYPLIVISLLIGVGTFFLSESIVPVANFRANKIWNVQVKKKNSKGSYKLSRLWYKGKNSIYKIRTYDSERMVIEGLTVFFFDDDFKLIKKIDAGKASWIDGVWRLQDGVVHVVSAAGPCGIIRFKNKEIKLPENPQNFERSIKLPEEMSYWELKSYVKKLKDDGYDSIRSQVELDIKIAFPCISMILTLVGIPIALRKRKGGIPLSITIGIGLCFLYLLAFGIFRSLALSNILPSMLGVWLANLLFVFFGIYLMLAEDN